MSTMRRCLILAALTVSVLFSAVAVTLPAQASFADSAVTTTTYTTANVAAPGNVVGSLNCGNPNSTMGLTWQLSTSSRISGYLITVYFSDGYSQTVQMGATATSWTQSISTYNVTAYSVQYSVTTQTNYGWTKESAKTGWFHC